MVMPGAGTISSSSHSCNDSEEASDERPACLMAIMTYEQLNIRVAETIYQSNMVWMTTIHLIYISLYFLNLCLAWLKLGRETLGFEIWFLPIIINGRDGLSFLLGPALYPRSLLFKFLEFGGQGSGSISVFVMLINCNQLIVAACSSVMLVLILFFGWSISLLAFFL